MQKKKRNRNAGKHPSYKKRGMSKEAIKKKREYDKKYHATKSRKAYRVVLNKANREKGKVGDGKDMSHTSKGLVKEKQSKNRARNGQKKGISTRSIRASTKK